jgi:TonB family protein
MKNKLILIAALCLVSSVVRAQDSTTIFYNEDWKVVENNKEASFYRKEIKRNDILYVKDYFAPNNVLQMSGSYKSDTIKSGAFTYYYNTGQKSGEGVYVNGKRDGSWRDWHENGNESTLGTYKEGYLIGKFDSWYDNGNKYFDGQYISDIAKIKSYEKKDSTGKPIFIGSVEDGLCKYYYPDGVVSAAETWKDNHIVEMQVWSKDGIPETVEKDSNGYYCAATLPEFKGGSMALMKYLGENIKYPRKARNRNQQGRVIVKFVVDTDGGIINTKVNKTSGYESIDEEALRVVNTMSGMWKPGKQNGQLVKVYYLLPVTFRLDK